MYGINTGDEIPPACRTEQKAWDEYVAAIWVALLKYSGFSANATVVEIGPGVSAKIGAALGSLDFKGTLYAVDSSAVSLRALKEKYTHYLPRADVRYIEGDFEAVMADLPKAPDYVLASHVLDDMIIAECAKKEMYSEKEKIFSWSSTSSYAPATTGAFEAYWKHVSGNAPLLAEARHATYTMWVKALQVIQPKQMIMSQYPSATLAENGLDDINRHTDKLFRELHNHWSLQCRPMWKIHMVLDKLNNYNHFHTGAHLLNAHYWMMYQAASGAYEII